MDLLTDGRLPAFIKSPLCLEPGCLMNGIDSGFSRGRLSDGDTGV